MTKLNSIQIQTADFVHVDALHLFHAQQILRLPADQRHYIKNKNVRDIHELVAHDGMLMATQFDQICGMISVRPQPLPHGHYHAGLTAQFRQARDIAEMNSFVVAPSCRGQGVGHTLIKSGLHVAKDKGFKHLFARVAADNKVGLHSFDTHGFKQVGQTLRDDDPNINLAVLMRPL
jgi:ribosomal protein S18 acetylase RimI-like enzyme